MESCHAADSFFLWMCFFCNNQRKLLLDGTFVNAEDLEKAFSTRLEQIQTRQGHVIVLLNDYNRPVYIDRVWCIFETFKATTIGLKIEVVLTGDSHDSLYTQIQSG